MREHELKPTEWDNIFDLIRHSTNLFAKINWKMKNWNFSCYDFYEWWLRSAESNADCRMPMKFSRNFEFSARILFHKKI